MGSLQWRRASRSRQGKSVLEVDRDSIEVAMLNVQKKQRFYLRHGFRDGINPCGSGISLNLQERYRGRNDTNKKYRQGIKHFFSDGTLLVLSGVSDHTTKAYLVML